MTEPEIRTLFVRHDLRCTRQRLDVYAALASTKSHPTAEELHRLVQGSSPGTSLATVYNTLDALCSAGLAQRMATAGPSGARYDADVSDHLHLVTDSGEVVDVPHDLSREVMAALPADLLDRVSRRTGRTPGRLSISIPAPRS